MSDRGTNMPTVSGGDRDPHWLDYVDTGLIEAHFTEHYGAEDVRDELRQIMDRYSAAASVQGAAAAHAHAHAHAHTAMPTQLQLLDSAASRLGHSVAPSSTHSGAAGDRRQHRERSERGNPTPRSVATLTLAESMLSPSPPRPRSIASVVQLAALRRSVRSGEHLPNVMRMASATMAPSSLSSRMANARIGVVGRLNKARLMGALIEVVETCHVEYSFCEYLNKRLLDFRRQSHRDFEPLFYGDEQAAAMAGLTLPRLRFAEAISYLDEHVREDRELYQIVEDCVKKFRMQRIMLCNRAGETHRKFYQLLDQLMQDDSCEDMKAKLREELYELYAVRRYVRKLRKDVQVMPLTDDAYNQMMLSIKRLIAKLCLFMPTPVPSNVRWVLMRNEVLRETSDHINEDLAAMHVDLMCQKGRLLEEQRREKERACGHLVEVCIVKAPARQERPLAPEYRFHLDSDSDEDAISVGNNVDSRTMYGSEEEREARRQSFTETARQINMMCWTPNAENTLQRNEQAYAREQAELPAGLGTDMADQLEQRSSGENNGETQLPGGAGDARILRMPTSGADDLPPEADPARVVTFSEEVLVVQY